MRRSIACLVVAISAGASAPAHAGDRTLGRFGPATVAGVVADGDRYFAYQAKRNSPGITVVDTVRGTRRRVALPAGCGFPSNQAPDFVGGGHMLLSCQDGSRPLLRMRTGTVRELPAGTSFTRVGRHWVSGEGTCATECVTFFNLRTGEQRSVPGPDAEIDLDRRAFSRIEFCGPFRGPRQTDSPGTAGYDAPHLLRVSERRVLTLGRCGRRSVKRLDRGVDGGDATLQDGLAVWSADQRLKAHRIRDGRSFRWRIPRPGRNGHTVLRTRNRAFVAVVTRLGGSKIETPQGYRLYSATLPR